MFLDHIYTALMEKVIEMEIVRKRLRQKDRETMKNSNRKTKMKRKDLLIYDSWSKTQFVLPGFFFFFTCLFWPG